MSTAFHVIDLVSQELAVESIVKGLSEPEQLAWLAQQGDLSPVPIAVPGSKTPYRFVSRTGMEAVFFFDQGGFVFLGDHTTIVRTRPETT